MQNSQRNKRAFNWIFPGRAKKSIFSYQSREKRKEVRKLNIIIDMVKDTDRENDQCLLRLLFRFEVGYEERNLFFVLLSRSICQELKP